MNRILEPESMDIKEEVIAYDKISKKFGYWFNEKFADSALKVGGGRRILDIGIGPGRIPIEIVKRSPNSTLYGIDISLNMLKIAGKNIKNQGLSTKINLLQADGKRLSFKANSFDMVVCSQMLHQLKEPLPLLNEINRVVKPNGAIFIKDLIRPSRFLLKLFMGVIGITNDRIMNEEYRNSLQAAFTIGEYKEMLNHSNIKGATIFLSLPHYIYIVKKRK